ncbi:MAG: hypothetical protein ABSB10_06620 [Candidatus Bathyarchaeia archaeon]
MTEALGGNVTFESQGVISLKYGRIEVLVDRWDLNPAFKFLCYR